MKIALAQIRSYSGDVNRNIETHIKFINRAVGENVDLIVFPELSLTNYEPSIVSEVNFEFDDIRLDVFERMSEENAIVICVGLPLKTENGINICMMIFEKGKRRAYSKQWLHIDEKEFFIEGVGQEYIEIKGKVIAPAICYESMQVGHIENLNREIDLYLASVSKTKDGMERAYKYYENLAKSRGINVAVVNSIGESDNFIAAGLSGVWDKNGELKVSLNDGENMLIFEAE